MNPAEVIKQRLQMYNSPYRSVMHCAREILRNEGMKAFYRSYSTQLTMNIPFHSIHLIIYEYTQEMINKERAYNPSAHMISGAIAGAIASGITTPLDVCKTLLNTQESNVLTVSKRSHISGIANAGAIIYRCCGIKGYFNGMQARVMFSMPSTAISWTVYESFKFYLNASDQSKTSLTDRGGKIK
jgi:solute carrier family 25 iron transporter 28/37